MSDREFVVSTRFYLNSFDFTQFNLNKGPFFNQKKTGDCWTQSPEDNVPLLFGRK